MIAKYINHFTISSMFTAIDYHIIRDTKGLFLNYYWIIVQNFLNDSVFLNQYEYNLRPPGEFRGKKSF